MGPFASAKCPNVFPNLIKKIPNQKINFSSTLKCLSIGTPNATTFPFIPNGK